MMKKIKTFIHRFVIIPAPAKTAELVINYLNSFDQI